MGLWKASRLPGRPVPYDERRVRRPMIAGAGWLAAAGIATVIGLAGIRLVGESLTGTPGGVLSQDEVERALAAGTAAPAAGATSDGPVDPSPGSAGTGQPGDAAIPFDPTVPGGPLTQPTGTSEMPPAGQTTTPGTTTPGATTPATRPAPTTGPATAAPVQRTFSARGGSAIAACPDGLAFLVSWTPSQGYGVKDARRGPGGEVRVRFEGSDGRSEIRISCSQGIPVADIRND
jgi:hypothetical protein